MKRKFRDYQEELLEALQDPEEALAYLNEALSDEDPRVFLLALKQVMDAQGEDMAELAKKSRLNRENLYRMLSRKGNPKLTSIRAVLDTLGLQLAIQDTRSK